MAIYKNVNYEATSDLRDAINANLSTLGYPFSVRHKINGEGQLVDVKAPLSGGTLFATIDFESIGSKMFAVDAILGNRLVEMPEELKTEVLEAQTAFKSDYDTVEQIKREAFRKLREQEQREQKEAEEKKKLEAKYNATKARLIKDFETMANREKVVSEVDEFYYCLGWIAKNCGAFACALPDYLLPYFQSKFGSDYEPRVVDSKKRTVNGNSMQWTISMTASIKKSAQDKVPALLTKYLNKSGTSFANTEFIWDLVENYGFKFGKTQDVDQIRSVINTNYIESFEEGYAE